MGRAFAAMLLACLGLLAAGAPAQAATGVLDPNVDTYGVSAGSGWAAGPNSASSFWMVLQDQPRPWAPGTDDDNINASTAAATSAEVGLESYALAAGEQVVLARAWAFIEPSSGRPLTWELRTGARVLDSGTVAAGSGGAWRSVEWEGGLSQAELDDLRLRFTTVSLNGDTNVQKVKAAHVEFETRFAPAAPTFTSAPASPGKVVTPSWSFDVDPAAVSNECRVERGATVVADWAACSSPVTTATLTTDGQHRFRVRSFGAGGLTGPIASSFYTLDTTPPPPPTITSGPTGSSKNPAIAYAFTGEAGAAYSCRLERPGFVVDDWAPCVSGRSYNLATSLQPDATYTFSVRATDAATNTGDAATRSFTYDTTKPVPPTITSGPGAFTKDPLVSGGFTAEVGATTECQLQQGATVVVAWVACSSPTAYNLTSRTDGQFRFAVRARDAADNVSDEAERLFTLDRGVPAAPSITSGPTGPTKDPAPSFAFTGEPSATFACRIERDGTVVSDWSACTSARTYSLSTDGPHVFRVKQTDQATNESLEATRSFTLDRSPPEPPTITAAPTTPAADPAAAWSFTAEAGSFTSCRLMRGTTTISDWALCNGSASYSGLADGAYTFEVYATDLAGNPGTATVRTYTRDSQAPDPPQLTSAPPATRDATTVAWSFTAEASAAISCRLERNGVVVPGQDWQACTSPKSYDLSGPGRDGAYTFRVRARDAAQNTSDETVGSYVLDTVDPAAPVVTSGPSDPSKSTSPSWSFTTDAGTTTECQVDNDGTVVSGWGPCTSPRSYTLGVQPDGELTFSVRATDSAGNTGAVATRTHTLDQTAPLAPTITTAPPARSNDPRPAYAFTVESGSAAECRLTRAGDATPVEDWTACAVTKGYDLTVGSRPDDTYTFSVRTTDAAQNTSLAGSRSFVLDRAAPPQPVLTSAPPATSDALTAQWAFTAEADAVTSCRLERNGVLVPGEDWQPCTSPKSYDLSGPGRDGAYTFRVRARDVAGTTGDETVGTYVLDTIDPAAPVVTSGPADPSNSTSPSWSFTNDAGTTTECQVDRDGTVVSAWGPCTSPRSYALGVQPDGELTVSVRATDAAGNTGPVGTRTHTLDQTRPATPVVTGGPPANSADKAPAFSFTVEAGTAPSCRLERVGTSTPVSDWAPCSSPKGYDLTVGNQPDGTYVFRVRSRDDAGNDSLFASRSFDLDTLAPNQPSITGRPGSSTNDTTPTWTWTGEAGANFRCQIDRGDPAQPVFAYASCTSPHTYPLADEGVYTFRVRASDPAGNQSTVATDTFALDTTRPAAPAITGPNGPSSNDQPSYGFTAEGGAALECRFERPGFVVRDWEACLSPRPYDLRAGHPDAEYTFSVRATDAAGNVGFVGTRSYTLDRAKPAAPLLAGPAGDTNDDTPVWTFTGEPGTTARCALNKDGVQLHAFDACSSPVGYDVQGDDDATYTVRVTITDAAGNVSDEGTRTIRLDRVKPLVPVLTARPGDDTNAATLSWSHTTSGATATQCRLERGATVVSDWSACASPRAYASQPEGEYVFRVRGTDDAGNVGDERADSTRVDRTKPVPPSITAGPTGRVKDGTPSYTFTAEADADLECRMDRGTTLVSDWAACTSPRSYTLGADDGDHAFSVRATDAAGNVSDPATRSYTLDREAPPAPTITTRPAPSTKDDTPTWAFTATDGATYRCRVSGAGDADVISSRTCTSPATFDVSGAPDGLYTLHVWASDIAENESAETRDTFTLDRDEPDAPAITGGPTGPSRELSPTYAFTAEASSTTACRLERAGTGAPVSDWASCTSPHAYTLPANAPDDEYTFRVRATDEATNTGDEATRTYTLDRTKPVPATITAGPTGDSADDTPTYAWTGEDGATAECRVERGTTAVRDWASCSSGDTFALGGETDGALRFLVRLTDRAGNVSDPAPREYTLDRTKPVQPTITAGPAADSTDFTPAFSFTAESGAVVECRLMRGTTEVEGWTACTSPRSYDLTTAPDGTYTFAVRARDAAGNQGDPRERSYALDRSTPLTPTIDARPGPQGNSRDPQWAFSTTESARTFECRLMRDTTTVAAWGGCGSPRTYSLLMQPDDTYTFAVRAVNAAGTRSDPVSDTYRLDTAKPAPVGISDGPAADSTDATPSWTLTGEPRADLECRLDRVLGDGTASEVADWARCTSPVGYDLSGGPDGTYRLTARATDEAGNRSDDATSTYTLDSTTPAAPTLGSTPPAAGSATDPSWQFSTTEPNKTFECRVSLDGAEQRGWSACTSPLTLALGTDGTYEVEIRTVNAAGTRSEPVVDTYDLDRVEPEPPVITDAPRATTADTTPTWAFTAEEGARAACSIEHADGTVARAWASCESPATIGLAGLPDGDYVFHVHVTDAAGNTSDDATRPFTLDTTIPGEAQFTSRPGSPAADLTPEWRFTGDAGMTLECRLLRGTAELEGWGACTSPHVVDLAGRGDATYELQVRQLNAADTPGPEVTDDYELDAAAPAAPVITGTPGETGRGSQPSWAFTAEANTTVECRLQLAGADVRAWAPCTSPRDYGLAGEPDGAYTFSARAIDTAGNIGPAATHVHALDRVAPEPPAVTGGPGPLGNGRAPSWSFAAEDRALVQCRLDRGATPLLDWTACQSPRGFDLAGQADGSYTMSVRAIDAAGNEGLPATSAYELDTTAGAVQITSGPGPLGNLRAPEWAFTGEGAAAFECRLSRREAAVADWQPCTNPRRFDLAGLPDGVFRFAARATDQAGNLGPVADTDYELDTTAPDAPSIDRSPASPAEDRSPTWRFSGESGVTYSCRVERRSSATVRDWSTCASPFTADLLRAAEAEYRFLVRATDRAGNVGPAASGSYELRKPDPAPEDGDGDDAPAKAPTLPPAREASTSSDAPAPRTTPAERRPAKKRPRAKSVQVKAPAAGRKLPGLTRRPKVTKPRPKPVVAARPPAAKPRPKAEPKANVATRALRGVANVVTEHPDKSVFPFSLILLVLGFLGVQNRIDRSDPKLALAPVLADPDMEFPPPPDPEPVPEP